MSILTLQSLPQKSDSFSSRFFIICVLEILVIQLISSSHITVIIYANINSI
ncbi:Uncharacterised protein [Capnocytophaga sputigena]|nr:Uncharacterised protein [Capnocytophaga sputigena]